jgi:glycosyltransferase involved in cell wall biosynthesis
MIHHVVKRAKKIIVVSENTRKDLIKLYPEAENKSTVIHPGIDNNLKPVPIEQSRECLVRLGIKKDYLLYVGNLRGIKNTSRLLKAYSLLRKKRRECPDLVLVGRNFFKKSELFPPGVFHLGEVKREDLASLYSRALLFVFPSFYEGFGLPPLEAMACGTPVVTSKVASLPEVCGDAAEYVDPYSEQSIIHGIETLLDSSSRRDSLRKMGFENVKRFDNKKFAREIWKIYEEASA